MFATELMRNLALWPVNLARDGSRRLGRTAGVLGALAAGRPRSWPAWLHGLGWALFDLAGGPEIAQAALRTLTRTRPLTPAEISMASAVFGRARIRYRDVRIAQGGVLAHAFRANGGRAFATWHTVNMPDGRDEELSLLIHELTHVLQYERVGSVYIGQGLWAQRRHGKHAYHTGGDHGLIAGRQAGLHLRDFNREQQGAIAQEYCRCLIAGAETSAYEPFIAELRQGAL
jgi:hypothetical protein